MTDFLTLDSITTALTTDQSVLIPALPPTRVLDLLLLLDNAFLTTPVLHPFPIFYLARTSQKAVSATRTMLEWLSQDINLQDHPLVFKHVKIVSQYADLTQGPPGARVVVVDGHDIELGSFARQAFLDFKSSSHLLFLTSRGVTKGSISDKILALWEKNSPSLANPRPIVPVQFSTQVEMEHRTPLEGEELAVWRRLERANREQKDTELFFEERQRNLLEGAESDEDEDEEDQLILDSEVPTRVRGSAILLQEGTYDFWLKDAVGRASLRHFPFVDKRRRFDEFGATVKAEEYARVEDDVVVQKVETTQVGRKRKWVEVEATEEDVPARVAKTVLDIDVNVRAGYVDLEGLHDGRAAGNLLPRLNARKLVT